MQYDQRGFVGYTMDSVDGENFNKPFVGQRVVDLELLARRYFLLEQLYIKGHKQGVVFADSLAQGNLKYNSQTKGIKVIDYDGLQVNKISSGEIYEEACEDKNPILNSPKYFVNSQEEPHFNKDIDLFALTLNFIFYATNINIAQQDQVKTPEYIMFIAKAIGLEDRSLIRKLMILFDPRVSNEYLGEDMLRLAQNYYLKPVENGQNYCCFTKKR